MPLGVQWRISQPFLQAGCSAPFTHTHPLSVDNQVDEQKFPAPGNYLVLIRVVAV